MKNNMLKLLNPIITLFGYFIAIILIGISMSIPVRILIALTSFLADKSLFLQTLTISIAFAGCYLIFGFTLLLLIIFIKRITCLSSSIKSSDRWSIEFFRFGAYSSLLGLAQFFFLPLIKSTFLINYFYRGMGAKIGKNTIIGSTKIFDCNLVTIGDNCVIGGDCIINGHMLEGSRLIKGYIKIGNNVTIGTCSMILPGVTIENNIILGANSLVTKFKTLKANNNYGGVPVKLLYKKTGDTDLDSVDNVPSIVSESKLQLNYIKEKVNHADVLIKLYDRLSVEIVAFETLIANVFISSTSILFSIILYGIINDQPKLLLVIAPLIGIASSFFISTTTSMLRAAFKKSQIEIFFQTAGVKYFNWETRYGELGKSRISDLDGILIFIIYFITWGAGLFITFNESIVTKQDLFLGYSIFWILVTINIGIVIWVMLCFVFFTIKSKFYRRELINFRQELTTD